MPDTKTTRKKVEAYSSSKAVAPNLGKEVLLDRPYRNKPRKKSPATLTAGEWEMREPKPLYCALALRQSEGLMLKVSAF